LDDALNDICQHAGKRHCADDGVNRSRASFVSGAKITGNFGGFAAMTLSARTLR
jgi:hypothetical protein